MKSDATTPSAYLAELPPDRRHAIKAVRTAIRQALPKGFVETMQYGMISYVVPLSYYPAGYHCDGGPLPYASLASQKNHMALYLMNLYSDPNIARWFREACTAAGKKLDMGKCCIRFRTLEDLPLDLVSQAVAKTSVDEWIRIYESHHPKNRKPLRKKK